MRSKNTQKDTEEKKKAEKAAEVGQNRRRGRRKERLIRESLGGLMRGRGNPIIQPSRELELQIVQRKAARCQSDSSIPSGLLVNTQYSETGLVADQTNPFAVYSPPPSCTGVAYVVFAAKSTRHIIPLWDGETNILVLG
ncbi:hypothetical protein PAAG_02300 [Paracoccidioides lutzii Pb01]|uniref:Uncharacterized protein n=1 Tax=Paracoccidioides lutzii (strain ATCC MYA-826 / Pb01) TaxID=502779 RepID=C1GVM3_PARBA|nr:hypothetical protein PAAG_02300 [Paracoccidioides lutzii Pb01]EEH40245.2 hypothetical protein PAAG_02300 [Paracoccidioides lutzii Pb01]